MKRRWWLILLVVVALATAVVILEPTRTVLGYLRGEPFFDGRSASYWAGQLRDPAPDVQVKTRAKLTDPAAAPVLIDLLQRHRDTAWSGAEVRWLSAEILGRIGDEAEGAVAALTEALHDRDPHVRAVAVHALGIVGPGAVVSVPSIIELVSSDSDRLGAIKTLAVFGDESRAAVPALVEALHDRRAEVRWNAAKTLGKIGPDARAAVTALSTALKDEDSKVREHAAEALGDIGPDAKASVPDLIRALKDPEADVRRDAVRSLGKFGPAAKSAAPAIEELLKDQDPAVHVAATKALRLVKQ
jgi:HEAT repeat protein